jgi:hypothetical protein
MLVREIGVALFDARIETQQRSPVLFRRLEFFKFKCYTPAWVKV